MAQVYTEDFPIDPVPTSGAELAAILSRFAAMVQTTNSGATAPAEPEHGTLWLDTSGGAEGVLKMRNAANGGWLRLLAPSGPQLFADGTVGAPSIAFTNEAGLGLYRPKANEIGITTAGAQIATFNATGTANSYLSINPRAANAKATLQLVTPH